MLVLAALAPSPAAAIVGGVEDTGGLARSAVMVLSSNGGVCSAVVVAPDVVLTAAHCVTGAAEHRVHFKGPGGEPVLIAPAAKAVHPGYDSRAIEARRRSIDLALLRLPEALPARFERAILSGASPPAGSGLALGGYGVAREGDARSTGTFRVAALTLVEPYGPSRILVWAKGERSGACSGDSGGPIASGDAVFAIASWARGSKAGGCGDLSQGALLGAQRAWIDRVLSGWGASARWE